LVIRRTLHEHAVALAARFPVVTITGPRQSGKTTLSRMAFPRKPYVNLELPDLRDFALSDPRGFLAAYPDGAVLDEVQRAPDLLSYIQDRVDRHTRKGEFILTGSQHFGLLQTISQSLAGRTAVLNLLPLALDELRRSPNPPEDLYSVLLAGGYPRIHEAGLTPAEWLASYVATYVERDVRQVLNVGDLTTFQTFLRLCAGRVGQVVNLSALGSDAGVTHNTAKAWLSVLETGFIAFRVPPLHRNLRKRLTKSPKLFFCDVGLVCYLLGIRDDHALRDHPLRGAIFECWAATEILKARAHRGLEGALHYFRDHRGREVNLVLDTGGTLTAVEMKSGETIPSDAFAALVGFQKTVAAAPKPVPETRSVLVHGGDARQQREAGLALPWTQIAEFDWASA
jgi:predicted AAA+ superfamily ATPase